MISHDAGVGLIFEVVGADVDSTGRNYKWWVNKDAGINLPDPRPNIVYAWGHNIQITGEPEDPTDATFFQNLETHYVTTAGVPVMEYHIGSHDLSGTPHRALSFMLAKDGSDAVASFQVDTLNFGDYANSFQCLQISTKNRQAWIKGGMRFNAEDNNYPVFQQKSAYSSSLLPLPFFDEGDVLVTGGQGMAITGNASQGGDYAGRFVTFNCMGGVANGGSVVAIYNSPITGDVNAILLNGAVTGEKRIQLFNSSETGTAVLDLATAGTKAFAMFRSGSGAKVCKIGIDGEDLVLIAGSAEWRFKPNGTSTAA